tara:strand:+ start:1779 stop:1907 length:129 start_codon:yes stop_codon:yes gene_type:complete
MKKEDKNYQESQEAILMSNNRAGTEETTIGIDSGLGHGMQRV